MTRNDPSDKVGHVEFFLAGDLKSPVELLGSDSLSDDQKKEVLLVWRRDLMKRGGWQAHEELLTSIDESIALLEADRSEVTDDQGKGSS